MRGRSGIAEQDDVLMAPPLAEDTVKIEPGRTAQMACIRHQFVAGEIAGEDSLARRNRLLGVHLVEPGAAPCLLRAFDDKGRGVGIELVGVYPDPAVLGLLKDKSEGVVEFLVRAEPDVL